MVLRTTIISCSINCNGGIIINEIFTRVSTRKFEDRPVETEKITQLLKAAMQAPSAGNQQPWEFFVVTDKEKIKALSESNPYAGCAAGAPVVIVPCYNLGGNEGTAGQV